MNEQQQIPTSEVLHKAADLIEERGWVQGPGGWGDDVAAPLCIEGGIGAALGLTGMNITVTGRNDFENCPAYRAVRSYLAEELAKQPDYYRDTELVYAWNDAPERTAAEVVEVLRAAAVIEASRERSAADERAAAAAVQS